MGHEIELKFAIIDVAALRGRLAGIGAACAGRVLEANTIVDTPDHQLLAADCGLRLREIRPMPAKHGTGAPIADNLPPEVRCNAALTYKGPRFQPPAESATAFKSREELETPVGDATVMLELLARLGYHPVITYEKRRETWRHGACTVELDELPRLGWWVEIEGPDEAAVTATREALELAATAPASDTYVAMAARAGTVTPAGVRELRFAPDA